MGVRRTTLALFTLFGALLSSPAHAALWMEFEPPSGHPGTEVVGHTMGNGALRVGEGPYPAYLVPVATNDRTPIGKVIVGARDNGTLRFKVPEVPSGKYEVRIECEPCAPSSAGQTELTMGEFRVLGVALLPPVEPSQSPWVSIAVLIACCALLGGLMLRPGAPSSGIARRVSGGD